MEIKFKLGETLKELEISNNKLAVEAKIRPGTIGDLVSGKSKSINFDTLVTIINTLNRISFEKGNIKKYGITDVIEY